MQILDNKFGIKKTCPHCQSKLLIEERDVRVRWDHTASYTACDCGACRRQISVPWNDIPYAWKTYLAWVMDD